VDARRATTSDGATSTGAFVDENVSIEALHLAFCRRYNDFKTAMGGDKKNEWTILSTEIRSVYKTVFKCICHHKARDLRYTGNTADNTVRLTRRTITRIAVGG